MTKFEKMQAKDALRFFERYPVAKSNVVDWTKQVHDVLKRYFPKSNLSGYIAGTFFTVKKDSKGKMYVVLRHDNMTFRQQVMSAKNLIGQLRAQLEAEIGIS